MQRAQQQNLQHKFPSLLKQQGKSDMCLALIPTKMVGQRERRHGGVGALHTLFLGLLPLILQQQTTHMWIRKDFSTTKKCRNNLACGFPLLVQSVNSERALEADIRLCEGTWESV